MPACHHRPPHPPTAGRRNVSAVSMGIVADFCRIGSGPSWFAKSLNRPMNASRLMTQTSSVRLSARDAKMCLETWPVSKCSMYFNAYLYYLRRFVLPPPLFHRWRRRGVALSYQWYTILPYRLNNVHTYINIRRNYFQNLVSIRFAS